MEYEHLQGMEANPNEESVEIDDNNESNEQY